jgi:rhodanese-related sulfurtransferase
MFGKTAQVKEIGVAEAVKQRGDTTVQFVDVREGNEWRAGHMPGSTHIPLGELAHRVGELDPARPVVVVCASGGRSYTAADLLTRKGFTDTASLAGGLMAWYQAGQPLER